MAGERKEGAYIFINLTLTILAMSSKYFIFFSFFRITDNPIKLPHR